MGKNNQNISKKQKKSQKQLEKSLKKSQKDKKQVKDHDQNSQSDSQDADIDLNQLGVEEAQNIEVGFLIAEIQDDYYHSLKTILLRIGQVMKITNSELADAIVQNKKIGNVVLADDEQQQQEDEKEDDFGEDDEENVYSILTILPGNHKSNKKIRSIVSKAFQKKEFSQDIKEILNSDKTGIILNERLSNLPAFIANSAHQVFKKDMDELKKNERNIYDKYCSGYLLNISQIQYEGSQDLDKLIFSKFQDFQMCKRAKIWWLGDKNQSYKKKADMRTLYYIISSQQYFKGVAEIKTYLQSQ